MSRAARVAAGAALLGAACGSGTTTVPLYGAPIVDGGDDGLVDHAAGEADGAAGQGGAAGGAGGSAVGGGGAGGKADAGTGGALGVPIYGAAAPVPRKPVP